MRLESGNIVLSESEKYFLTWHDYNIEFNEGKPEGRLGKPSTNAEWVIKFHQLLMDGEQRFIRELLNPEMVWDLGENKIWRLRCRHHILIPEGEEGEYKFCPICGKKWVCPCQGGLYWETTILSVTHLCEEKTQEFREKTPSLHMHAPT